MGVYKPRRSLVICGLLPLVGCGLERDLKHVQDLAERDTGLTGLSTSDPDLSTSTSSDETTTGPVSSSGDGLDDTSTSGTTAAEATGLDSTANDESTLGDPAQCGDRQVEGDEECDDPDDASCRACLKDWLVFVTSTVVSGDFAEAGPLEAECNRLADLAGLLVDHEPKFFPWISTKAGDAADYLHHARGRYVLRDGSVLADSWEALVAGELQHFPNIDENGAVWNVAVWTGTSPDGIRVPQSTQCNNWIESDSDFTGSWGYSKRLDAEWTQWADPEVALSPCGGHQALYCFEQP